MPKNIILDIRDSNDPLYVERTVGRNNLDNGFVEYIAEVIKCRCCQNNWDDPEHHHSSSCSPNYREDVTGHYAEYGGKR